MLLLLQGRRAGGDRLLRLNRPLRGALMAPRAAGVTRQRLQPRLKTLDINRLKNALEIETTTRGCDRPAHISHG